MYHPLRISSNRRFLDRGATETLIHASISSRLDYCNSLLIELPIGELNRLQRMQNVAVRMLTFTRRHEPIRRVLYSLHWLPVSARIEFKVITKIFKCLHDMVSEYLTELLDIYKPPRGLRLAMQLKRCERRRANLKSAGDKSFSNVTPKLFNLLPKGNNMINNIQIETKTFLFPKFYHDGGLIL